MKKAIKMSIIIFSCILLLVALAFSIIFTYYSILAKKEVFDSTKLASSSFQIQVFDNNGKLISDKNQFNNQNISIKELSPRTINAFVSIEDKNFYSHSGVNYKRMVKALLKNISSGKLKEGASTISQQLIKNTHLTNEKTYERKIKEIFLAKEMEKQLSKDEIIESYLNVIYYGNNVYGIENASRFYFSKPASNLSLTESATLAGIIKSPGNYCPINKPENCLKRRNLVLLEMFKDGKITEKEYSSAKETPLNLKVDENFNNGQNTYSQASIDEACRILNLPTKQIALGKYKIYTYQNPEKQSHLENAIKNKFADIKQNDVAGISVNNETFGVEAYFGKSAYSILDAQRQPGSIIKPLLVYGPAINENILSPATEILDDEININGYKPQNVNNKFSGYISVRDAVAKSTNIPAVKTLSYVGIDKAKRYAERFGIEFDEKDNGYALALGGMTYGTDLKTLASAYASFGNSGKFAPATFVKEIRDKNDKVIYSAQKSFDQILREDANYLTLNTMLETVKSGTARRLNPLPYQIASKTGTVGKNSTNFDAYNLSLTSEDTVGVWVGNLNGKDIGNITGGILPTEIIKSYFEKVYSSHTPKDFAVPTSIDEVEIDALELEHNHIIVKANDFIPSRYKQTEIFSKFNLPKERSSNFLEIEPAKLSGKVENNNIILNFDAENYLIYDLYKIDKKEEKLIKTFEGLSGNITQTIPFGKEKTEKYFLKTKIKNHATGEILESSPSNIIELNKNSKSAVITDKKNKWYI